jgi:hypothetical protein
MWGWIGAVHCGTWKEQLLLKNDNNQVKLAMSATECVHVVLENVVIGGTIKAKEVQEAAAY